MFTLFDLKLILHYLLMMNLPCYQPTSCRSNIGNDSSFSSYIISDDEATMRLSLNDRRHGDGPPSPSYIADIPCMDRGIEVTWKESNVSS